MNVINQVFKEELILLDKNYDSQEDFFNQIAGYLHSLGKVKAEFGKALKKREAEYPTGLMTEAYGVALPHTDAQHVIDPCLAFVRFAKPLLFSQMGGMGELVPARFAFVLCIKEPEKQVDALSMLVSVITNKERMGWLEQAPTRQTTADILNQAVADILKRNN